LSAAPHFAAPDTGEERIPVRRATATTTCMLFEKIEEILVQAL
jgi:hypothetical protein